VLGIDSGMLKLLFDPVTRKLLGVHAFGERPMELIHVEQAVLSFGGIIDNFRDTVFNHPTMAEAYMVAGRDGPAPAALSCHQTTPTYERRSNLSLTMVGVARCRASQSR
jgi:hypothetical protein